MQLSLDTRLAHLPKQFSAATSSQLSKTSYSADAADAASSPASSTPPLSPRRAGGDVRSCRNGLVASNPVSVDCMKEICIERPACNDRPQPETVDRLGAGMTIDHGCAAVCPSNAAATSSSCSTWQKQQQEQIPQISADGAATCVISDSSEGDNDGLRALLMGAQPERRRFAGVSSGAPYLELTRRSGGAGSSFCVASSNGAVPLQPMEPVELLSMFSEEREISQNQLKYGGVDEEGSPYGSQADGFLQPLTAPSAFDTAAGQSRGQLLSILPAAAQQNLFTERDATAASEDQDFHQWHC